MYSSTSKQRLTDSMQLFSYDFHVTTAIEEVKAAQLGSPRDIQDVT